MILDEIKPEPGFHPVIFYDLQADARTPIEDCFIVIMFPDYNRDLVNFGDIQ